MSRDGRKYPTTAEVVVARRYTCSVRYGERVGPERTPHALLLTGGWMWGSLSGPVVTMGSLRFVERVTPLQVVRSGWLNDTNTLRDDEAVIVQVAVCRVLRRITGSRAAINISPDRRGDWVAWVKYHGEHFGSYEWFDSKLCMAKVREMVL